MPAKVLVPNWNFDVSSAESFRFELLPKGQNSGGETVRLAPIELKGRLD